MGCAEGLFVPLDEFWSFITAVSPETDKELFVRRWTGLSIATADGVPVECLAVALFEFDFGVRKEFRIDAIGIDRALYERLFPDHKAAYDAGLRR